MIHFRIKSQAIIGFAVEEKPIGKTEVNVATTGSLTSDDPTFYRLSSEVSRIFLNSVPIPITHIYCYLIVLHSNNEADIYINDFSEIQQIRINRNVKKGEAVKSSDIDDITEVSFPEIEVKEDDALIYCTKIGWKFILHFDFSRKLDLPQLYASLGQLHKLLFFADPLATISLDPKSKQRVQVNSALKVFVEGTIDRDYLLMAKRLLGYDHLIFEVVPIRDSNSSGGETKLNDHLHRLVHTNHEGYKCLFVFDCDATASYESCSTIKTDYVIPFIWPKNENNTISQTQRGVENLFNDSLFSDENGELNMVLFDKIEVYKNDVLQEKGCKKEVAKSRLLSHIQTRNLKEDFENFNVLFELIEKTLTQ